MRRAHEDGKFAGHFTVKRLASGYKIGDKVNRLAGRELDFAANARRLWTGESPRFPTIVEFDRENSPNGQSMTFQFEDRRAEPAPERSRRDVTD